MREEDGPLCPGLDGLIAGNLTHHSTLLLNCACVFISISGCACAGSY